MYTSFNLHLQADMFDLFAHIFFHRNGKSLLPSFCCQWIYFRTSACFWYCILCYCNCLVVLDHLWCYLTVESLNQCLTLIVANLLGQLKVSSGREVWKLSCIVQQPGLKKFLKDFVYFFNWTMKKKWFNF